jgi:amino acid adenylation domain-containing protein
MMDGAVSPAANSAAHRPLAHAWWRPTESPPHRVGSSDPAGIDPAGIDPDARFLDRPLFESFAAIAQREPTALAVVVGARSATYGDLLTHAASLAARIDTAAEPGVAVATLLPDPEDAVCGILACMAAGRPCIVLNPEHPAARLDDILADAAAGGLIVGPDGARSARPSATKLIPLRASSLAIAAAAPRPASQDAPGLIVYTSGSTGQPKGVVCSQRQMLARAGHRIRQLRLTPADRSLSLYPMSSGPGIVAALTALLSGGTLHVASASAIGARGVLGVARDARINTVASVPALLRTLLALDGAGEAFADLRSIATSSDSLLREDLATWRRVLPSGCLVRTGYGLTEGAPLADWFLPADIPGTAARLPIGYPAPWHAFAITDAEGAPVPQDQPGELWVRGRLLSLGEWRQGRCVPGRLLADPDDPMGVILRTGDLVRRRPDGLLEFLGRIDAQIRIRGNRVEPAEIEVVLRRTQGVADATVLARRLGGDTMLVAFVVPADGMSAGEGTRAIREAAIARLREALPSYMRPTRLHVISAVPKLPGGKVDPGALERLDDALIPQGSLGRLRRLVGLGAD